MNAQSVWPGHDYAYVSVVRRGVFPSSATKVKVITKPKKVQKWGNQRMSTYVDVQFESGATREVDVRNLFDFWDDWKAEHDHQERVRAEKQAERDRLYKEQQERWAREDAERQEKLRLENERKQRIAHNLAHHLGLDRSLVTVVGSNLQINVESVRFLDK